MDGLSVREYAKEAGISPQRARALTSTGRIPASRVGNQWVVHPRALASTPRISRPLTPRNAWLMATIAEGAALNPSPTAKDAYRARQKLTALAASTTPGLLAASWLATRARTFHILTRGVEDLVSSEHARVSGLSDPRSPLQSAREADIYVSAESWPQLRRSQALVEVPAERADAVVRVVDEDIPLPSQIPMLMVAADLFDRCGPREREAADSLVRTALGTRHVGRHG